MKSLSVHLSISDRFESCLSMPLLPGNVDNFCEKIDY